MNGSFGLSKGLEIKGSADNGVYVAGNNNRLENLDVHDNGIQACSLVRFASTALRSEWPANN